MKKRLNNILLGSFLIISSVTPSTSFIPANTYEYTNTSVEAKQKASKTANIELGSNERSIKKKNAEIIIETAKKNGIKPIDMLAMWHRESLAGDILVGDNGISHGHFHINLEAKPSAKKVVGDIKTEAQWVADRLKGYGYTEGYRTLAIAKYNLPADPNWEYAKKVYDRKSNVRKYLN